MSRKAAVSIRNLRFSHSFQGEKSGLRGIKPRKGWNSVPSQNPGRTLFGGLDLDLPAGTLCCIIGPSGCGKSTLLRLVGGFLSPHEGSIIIGEAVNPPPGRDRVLIFQEFDQLLPWLTVRGNLLFPLLHGRKNSPETMANSSQSRSSGKVPPRSRRKELVPLADHLLALTGLAEAAAWHPYQLSGGMKQRAAIARALMLKPAVLLMDEPFGSLDHRLRYDLQGLILDVAEQTAATILFVTHDLPEAVRLGDILLIMESDGSLTELLPNPLPKPRRLDTPEARALLNEVVGIVTRSYRSPGIP